MKLTVIYLESTWLMVARACILLFILGCSSTILDLLSLGHTPNRYRYPAWGANYIMFLIQYSAYVIVGLYFLFYGLRKKKKFEFNQAIAKLELGIIMLRVIIEQYQLTLSGKRSLTLNHLKIL